MKPGNGRVWIFVDQALKKLKSISHWTTSADIWHEDLKLAEKHLKLALKKLEEEK